MSSRPTFVSVIVPVWNDAARLDACLRALDMQTYPCELYEIVVVDNDSDEAVGPVVESHGRARLVHEARPGSYAARNTGLAHARGEILAFTDADCLPVEDWIERGVERLKQSGGGAGRGGWGEGYPGAQK